MSARRKHLIAFLPILLLMASLVLATGLVGERSLTESAAIAASAATIDFDDPGAIAPADIQMTDPWPNPLADAVNLDFPVTASNSSGSIPTINSTPMPELPMVQDADSGYTLTNSRTITGRVTNPWGRGIPGVVVWPRPVNALGGQADPAVFLTDDDGYYEIGINRSGRFRLHFQPGNPILGATSWIDEWYNNQPSEELSESVPTGASGVDAVLLPAGGIHGHLARPPSLVAPNIAAYRTDRPELVRICGYHDFSTSDFYFNSLPTGDYKILVMDRSDQYGNHGPFWYGGSSWETADTVRVTTGAFTNIEVPIPAETQSVIFGKLHETVSSVLPPGTVITLVDAAHPANVAATPGVAIDLGGERYFEFDEVAAGSYKIKATIPGQHDVWYAEGSDEGTEDAQMATVITIEPSHPLAYIDFRVTFAVSGVSGRIFRPDGTGFPSVVVYFKRIANGVEQNGLTYMQSSDYWGNYSGKLSPGSYRPCILTDREYCGELFTIGWHNTITGVDIAIPQDTASYATLMGKVQKPDGTGVPAVRYYAVAADGTVHTSWNGWSGKFSQPLPAGEYRVYVSGHGLKYEYGLVTLRYGEVVNITIQVPSDFEVFPKVTGQVQALDGSGISNIRVQAEPEDRDGYYWRRRTDTLADSEGRFKLSLLPGRYRLCVTYDHRNYCTSSFEVAWGDIAIKNLMLDYTPAIFSLSDTTAQVWDSAETSLNAPMSAGIDVYVESGQPSTTEPQSLATQTTVPPASNPPPAVRLSDGGPPSD